MTKTYDEQVADKIFDVLNESMVTDKEWPVLRECCIPGLAFDRSVRDNILNAFSCVVKNDIDSAHYWYECAVRAYGKSVQEKKED